MGLERGGGSKIRCSSVLTIILHSIVLFRHSARLFLGEVHGRGGIDALGCLSHYLQAFTSTAEQYHIARIPWVIELLGNLHECLSALGITISQAWLL